MTMGTPIHNAPGLVTPDEYHRVRRGDSWIADHMRITREEHDLLQSARFRGAGPRDGDHGYGMQLERDLQRMREKTSNALSTPDPDRDACDTIKRLSEAYRSENLASEVVPIPIRAERSTSIFRLAGTFGLPVVILGVGYGNGSLSHLLSWSSWSALVLGEMAATLFLLSVGYACWRRGV